MWHAAAQQVNATTSLLFPIDDNSCKFMSHKQNNVPFCFVQKKIFNSINVLANNRIGVIYFILSYCLSYRHVKSKHDVFVLILRRGGHVTQLYNNRWSPPNQLSSSVLCKYRPLGSRVANKCRFLFTLSFALLVNRFDSTSAKELIWTKARQARYRTRTKVKLDQCK